MGITNAADAEKRLADAVDRTTKAMERKRAAQARMERIEASAKKGAAIGAGMAAGGAAGMYAGRRTMQVGASPMGAFIQHEDAMLGIARQVPGARDEQGKLTAVYAATEEQVRALSHQIPVATTAIAEMFTAAARMEVPTDKLSDFVLMASEMATAFDAVPDEITESMGKVAKNFKIELTNIRGLADTINYLDDNAYLIFSLSLSVIGVIGSIIIFVIYGKEMRQYHRTNRSIPDTYFGWAAPTFIIFVVANAAFAIISFVGAMMG